MDFGLKYRQTLVAGGTKGRSIADTLAEEGAAVTISGRDQGRQDESRPKAPASGAIRGRASFQHCEPPV